MQKRILFILLCCCFTRLWSNIPLAPLCGRSADSLVLIKLYQSLDGPNWTSKWNLNQSMNSWFGVSLNSMGCVVQLNLSNNNLKGVIPNEIGSLGSLTRLFLFSNNIGGNLPSSLTSLTDLVELNLSDNFITGPLPNDISKMLKLAEFIVSGNALKSTIPVGMYDLINLVQLDLSRNQLFGNLSSDVSKLLKLQEFNLGQNNFSSVIPESIGSMTSLRDLFLNNNKFTGEPPSNMSNLFNMINLWMNDNMFTGNVPNLTNSPLLSLRIENNYFTNIPDYSIVSTFGRVDPLGLVMYNNNFTFEDLVPLTALPRFVNWNYKPQRPISLDSIQFVQYGSNYAIRLNIDAGLLDNNYKWFKDTAKLNITNQNFFQIIKFSNTDEGYYYGSVINQKIPDFKIDIPYVRLVGFNPGRCDIPLAGKTCMQAPSFCNTEDINNYCGNLSLSDENVRAALCDVVNDLENPRYLKFTANSDSIVLEIFPMSCNVVNVDGNEYLGLQAAILTGCDTSKASKLYCTTECMDHSFFLGGGGFIKGNEYLLVVDGCLGNLCNYLVKVREGKSLFKLLADSNIIGEKTLCPDTLDHLFYLNTVDGATSYSWYINDSLFMNTKDTFLNVRDFKSGVYKISVRAEARCDTTNKVSNTFTIYPKMEVNNFISERLFRDSVYQVRFKIEGGTPPFKLTQGQGILDSLTGNFVSSYKLCRSKYNYEIQDKWNCSVIISGTENCSCDSYAGTLPTEKITVCDGSNVVVKSNNDFIKDTGDVFTYLFCKDSLRALSTIIRSNQSGIFPFDISKYKYDTTYFVVFVIGRSNGFGQIDLAHPCLSISNIQPVVFRRKTIISAGPDLTTCSRNISLNVDGDIVKARWMLVSGPKNIIIADPDSLRTDVLLDSIGIYTFSVEGANNYCLSSDEVKIIYDTIFRPLITGDKIICGNGEGFLDVGEQLSYKWSTGDTTQSIKVKSSGRYCVTVTHSAGCVGDTCVEVAIAANPEFKIIGRKDICRGDTSMLQPDNNFLTYQWSNGLANKSIIVDSSGVYCVTVSNSEGCTAIQCVTVNVHGLSESIIIDSACEKSKVVILNKSYDVPGNYTILLKSANQFGCDSIIKLTLLSYPIVELKDSILTPDNGTSNGTIKVNFFGGKSPFIYNWSNGQTTKNLNGLKSGTYTLTITDANNCNYQFVFTIKKVVSVIDYEHHLSIEVFPNPVSSSDFLFWKTNELEGNWAFDFYDLKGQKVFHNEYYDIKKNEINRIAFHFIPSLYYLLARHSSGKIVKKKIMVIQSE